MKMVSTYLQNDVPITAEVLVAAANNAKCASALLDMLLEHWTEETIPISVVRAAAAHPTDGPSMIRLLQERSKKAIPVTDQILESAFSNIESGVECLEELWKEWPYLTIVGGSAIQRCYRGGDEERVLCWALSQPRQRVVFFKDAFLSILAERSVIVLEQIMTQYPSLPLAEDLLLAAASNKYHGASMFTFLSMSCPEQIRATKDLVTKAVRSDKKILDIILKHRPTDEDVITEEAIGAVKRQEGALEILHTLLAAKTGPFCPVKASHSVESLDLCLNHPNAIASLDRDIMCDLKYREEKNDMLKRILSLPDNQIQVSSDAAKIIILDFEKANTQLLLRCDNVCLTNRCVNIIVERHDADTVSLMLKKWIIKVTREIENAACQNVDAAQVLAVVIQGTSGYMSMNEKVLEIILSECKRSVIENYLQRLLPHTWTTDTIRLLATHQSKFQHTDSLVQYLLQSHQEVALDQQLIEEIAEFCDESVVATAIQRSSIFVHRAVAAALKNMVHGKEVIKLIIGDAVANMAMDFEFIHNLVRISEPETIHRVFQQHCQGMELSTWF
ncbi:hypothetical protein ABZX51_010142 [Aspergillus tubingensis]